MGLGIGWDWDGLGSAWSWGSAIALIAHNTPLRTGQLENCGRSLVGSLSKGVVKKMITSEKGSNMMRKTLRKTKIYLRNFRL